MNSYDSCFPLEVSIAIALLHFAKECKLETSVTAKVKECMTRKCRINVFQEPISKLRPQLVILGSEDYWDLGHWWCASEKKWIFCSSSLLFLAAMR